MKKAPKEYQQNIVKLSYNMSGKMTNVLSLSTNVNRNSRCMHRHNNCPTSICAHCFAVNTVNHYDSLHVNLNHNTDALIDRVLTIDETRQIAIEILYALEKNNTCKFRLESFGDLNNVTHAINYLQIVCDLAILAENHNYYIECALWTKNPDYLVKAFSTFDIIQQGYIRTVLNVLISSTFVGFPVGEKFIKKIENALSMPVGVFTVEQNENEKTNCGARDCSSCGRCYEKFKKTTYVYEVLK